MQATPRSNAALTGASSPTNTPVITSPGMHSLAASPSAAVDTSLLVDHLESTASCRRGSVGTASTVSLEGSTSSSGSVEQRAVRTRKKSLPSDAFKQSTSERTSQRQSMVPSTSIWNDAMKEGQ
jgi:hypothetical protein